MVDALIGLVAAVGTLALTTVFVLAVRALDRGQPAPIEEDLLDWAAHHPDRVHAPNTLAEEGM